MRKLGDTVTRFDRFETALNFRHDNEPDFDTTMPRALLHSMHEVVLGDALSAESRRLLQQWLVANATGGKRLKAGVAKNWRIGERTGTNRSDANDIGIAWPPDRGSVLATAYLADSKASAQTKDAWRRSGHC